MNDRHWHLATASTNGQLQTHAIFLAKPEVSGEGVVLQECLSGSCYAIELPNLRG